MPNGKLTPMMEQYSAIKQQYPDCILFFRLGDFYEMFGEDAEEASKILDIVLTSRNKGEDQMPMCGVPYHAADNYLAKLTKVGKKVAICEQMSDPKLPGIVQREVIRVVTPGTTLDQNLIEQRANNYIVCIYPKENYFGMSFADLTTGEFRVTEVSGYQNLKNELERLTPKECLIQKEYFENEHIKKLREEATTYFYPVEQSEQSYQILTTFFSTKNLEGFGIEKFPFGIQAAGTLLKYLQETQKCELKHMKKMSVYSTEECMMLDEATIRNLELTTTQKDGVFQGSLLWVIDDTATPMGGRLLKKWLLQPLTQHAKIEQRLDAVEEFTKNQRLAFDLEEYFKKIHDIERILGRLSLGTGNSRDLVALKHSLQCIPQIKEPLTACATNLLQEIRERLPEFQTLVSFLEKALIEDPPLTIREGGFIRDGFSEELDILRNISRSGQKIIQEIQEKESHRLGISSLKIRYNKIFGYYIEISNVHLSKVPLDYIRKQTLTNAERYITPELKEYEEKVVGAEERILKLEFELFHNIREEVMKYLTPLQTAAQLIAMLDVLNTLARVALSHNYCKPEISDGEKIAIKDSRHPVIEKLGVRFVPNDVFLDGNENRFLLITGPNMAGKSVYLRQIALITLMAHIGSFVPASQANIGLVDRIFTRVGAGDAMLKGQSTFMVEMQETANILNNATARSLIILDEIGRGTSTYDGVSIAWAITEHIHNEIRAKTIFATHYHELIAVAENLQGAKNLSAMVKETMEGVIFLYKIQKGGIDRSYGIEVAKLAGLPKSVTNRARQILEELEEGVVEKGIQSSMPRQNQDQMDLFKAGMHEEQAVSLQQTYRGSGLTHPAIEALKQVDVNHLTPIEALQKLEDLQAKLGTC